MMLSKFERKCKNYEDKWSNNIDNSEIINLYNNSSFNYFYF